MIKIKGTAAADRPFLYTCLLMEDSIVAFSCQNQRTYAKS